LLLGAGTLAAANFATSDTVQAETEAVTASGITSAETVQLGQSGRVIANLYSFVTRVKLLLLILLIAVQACRSVQLVWEHGVGVIEQVSLPSLCYVPCLLYCWAVIATK